MVTGSPILVRRAVRACDQLEYVRLALAGMLAEFGAQVFLRVVERILDERRVLTL